MKRVSLAGFVLVAVLATGGSLRAQAVETPQPFDSAGRVTRLTPLDAARLELRPPAWRITGDFAEARLFRVTDSAYVVVVTRRSGAVERYALTAADRDYLLARTSTLVPPELPPPTREGFERAAGAVTRETRIAFVRDQAILGLTVYGPAAAFAISDHDAGRLAAYLLTAGATFFGATTYARGNEITPQQNRLASHAALHLGGGGWAVATLLDADDNGTGASILVGALGGTTAGLWAGQFMTDAEVAASSFGADAGLVLAGLPMIGYNQEHGSVNEKTVAGGLLTAGLAGYPLGRFYARRATYHVTPGDVYSLWTAGSLGALAGLVLVPDLDKQAGWYAMTAGFAAGLVGGDFLLVRRLDYTRGEGATLGLGTAAGALIGAGVFTLVDRDRDNDRLLAGLAAAGAIGGAALTTRLVGAQAEGALRAGHAGSAERGASLLGQRSSWLRWSPESLLLAAVRAPGRHAFVRVVF